MRPLKFHPHPHGSTRRHQTGLARVALALLVGLAGPLSARVQPDREVRPVAPAAAAVDAPSKPSAPPVTGKRGPVEPPPAPADAPAPSSDATPGEPGAAKAPEAELPATPEPGVAPAAAARLEAEGSSPVEVDRVAQQRQPATASQPTLEGIGGSSPTQPKQPAADTSAKLGAARGTQLPAPPAPPRLVPEHRSPRLSPLEDSQLSGLQALSPERSLVAPAIASANTLILYDTTGTWGFLGELYAQQTANLVSRFGTWKALPVTSYVAGQLSAYTAVVYIGSTYDEPLPLAFLADVRATTLPVVWMYDNLWQLTAEYTSFPTTTGWTWTGFDFSTFTGVQYKGTQLDRDLLNGGGLMGTVISDPTKAQALATALKADGTTLPWAIQSGKFYYFTEIPFSYVTPNDRYLAFADLLYSVYAPATATRHRALVRIEDVGPDADPTELKAAADALFTRGVPFSVAVYPAYRDPNGAYNGGVATSYDMASRPAVVSALKYMQSRGGTLLMHGYTHQYSNLLNPYTGTSADDFEFYIAHIDAANNVVYDGPVPVDSQTWATSRIKSGISAFTKAGLTVPTIFEPPHYAASVPDYKAILALFPKRYDRGLYFGGILTGGSISYANLNGQFFPYPVRDIYGSFVIPENLGNVEPVPFNNHPARLPADILTTGQKNLVIRDGFASFFYHPYLGTPMLTQIVDGLKAQGWTFVAAGSITN